MFDIGFTEIVVIAVVALIVIGPERLPKTARTLGHLFGRLQRYVNDVKSDISREMELEELRKLQQEMKSAASDLESSMTAAARDVESGMRGVEAQLNAGASETPAPAPVQASEFAAPASAPSPAASAEAPPSEPARQPSLPGFDKI
ncbi:MAG: twin-arginine translocase subunit TatB [Betaproteobacteria bacterium]|nr:twin-arginine translocase subunit TatB [Betaproteobacteria bacterium]